MQKAEKQMSMPQDRAQDLANEHWKYIKTVLTAHFGANVNVDHLAQIELHYVTAMIHGYKHGWTDRDKIA